MVIVIEKEVCHVINLDVILYYCIVCEHGYCSWVM